MSALCTCDFSLGNTGQAGCQPIMKQTKMLIAVPTFDSTGVKNKILISATLDPSYLTARLNDTDASKRWYPIGSLRNVGGERPEPIYETAAGGQRAFVKEAIRTFNAQLWAENSSPQYLSKLKSFRCNDFSVYIIDLDNNLVGTVPFTEDGSLYPIRVDKATWSPNAIFGGDETVGKISIIFDWNENERDEQLRMIKEGEYTFDLTNANGLLDVNATYSSITTTGFTVDLNLIYGSAKNKIGLPGLVIGDFALYNTTDSASVTITSVTESATVKGRYVFVIPTQTSADVLRLTPTKNGYDFDNVVASPITIP
jgi:hypothetical protein